MIPIVVEINGRRVEREAEPRTHLADFIRDHAGLTGTHLGCEHGVCGACVVLLDGQPVRSCITFAVACEGRVVTTIEGHQGDVVMQRLRAAFTAHHALQCGYCTPGMLATARDIVLRLPDADERRIRAELSGNLCRCTGYQGIVNAILLVLADLAAHPDAEVEAVRASCLRSDRLPASAALAHHPAVVAVPDRIPAAEPVTASALGGEHRIPDRTSAPAQPMRPGAAITEQFDLPFPQEAVWALMSEPARVAACLPGAFLSGQEGARLTGGVALRFGPMQAKFEGDAVLTLMPAEQRARLQGQGRDRLSQSRAEGDIAWQVSAIGAQSTRVVIEMAYSLQGPLAQFSRSGLVQEFVRRIVQQFAGNVSVALGAPSAAATAGATAPPPAASTLNPISLLWAVIWARLRRLFGARD